MVEVSEKFMRLAQENGRRVWCKIVCGSLELLDDKILKMDFDDIIHPDWYTVGTTCANRLHFEAIFSGELSPGDEVRAFISFDGEEWCPLGIFYISRRYVRGDVVGITAYDRMYSLDGDYLYEGEIPTTADVLLKDVCDKNGIVCKSFGFHYKINELPKVCSVRDMIGYIACLNRACAKFDRTGQLVFKNNDETDFFLSEKNCRDIERNMTPSTITQLIVNTGEEIYRTGSNSQLNCLEMYNPFMTQTLLEQMLSMFKPFSFYGAEIDMQGMPFLESGDKIYLLENKMMYNLVISELEYKYDGGLSATLYSRNRTYEQESDDLEQLLNKLYHANKTAFYKQQNKEQLTLTDKTAIIASFELEALNDCFAQLDLNFSMKNNDGDFLEIAIAINGKEVKRDIIKTLRAGDYDIIHVYHLEERLAPGKNYIIFTARLKSGTAYIGKENLLATVLGYGLYGGVHGTRDKQMLYDKMNTCRLYPTVMHTAAVTDSPSLTNS